MLPSSTLDHLLDMSSPARRVLAEIRATWAQIGTKDGWLDERYEICERLSSGQALREQIQLKLAYLRDDTSASIAGYV